DPSTRTDAQGMGTMLVLPDAKGVVVGALKYEVAEVPIPAPLPDVLHVVLQRAAGLEIVVSSREGSPAKFVRARLSARTPDLWSLPDASGPHPTAAAAGATPSSLGRRGKEDASADFPVAADGRLVVSGLHPAVLITIAILDDLEHELATATVTLSA